MIPISCRTEHEVSIRSSTGSIIKIRLDWVFGKKNKTFLSFHSLNLKYNHILELVKLKAWLIYFRSQLLGQHLYNLELSSTSNSFIQCFPLDITRVWSSIHKIKCVFWYSSGQHCLEFYLCWIFVVGIFIVSLLEFFWFITSTQLFFRIQFFFLILFHALKFQK